MTLKYKIICERITSKSTGRPNKYGFFVVFKIVEIN
jgi:hypothetical protein